MDYQGTELELFAEASNWKSYLAAQITPFVTGRVLEVGAGIGANIPLFHNDRVTSWIALEPDRNLAATIEARRTRGELPAGCEVITGTLADMPADQHYNTIIYIDVLEHIDTDREEVRLAASYLGSGGHLIVLAPAHQFLFSPFDAAVGHFRRYNIATISALTPPDSKLIAVRMLDSAGFFLSLANRLVTRASMPTKAQIHLWDRWFVPASRYLDRVFRYRFGKSLLAVWQIGNSNKE